jgi:L-seryl-tRNA(Ser) seleniumtransferase
VVDVADSEEAARLIERSLGSTLETALSPSLRPVINATGVILHTNLGRAPLADAAIERISEIATGYSNLEYDLREGVRGSRSTHASDLLARLTGADDAIVVNNNAAALLLVLAALASGREVVISRGELVEIGDGFRIPDIMRQSGARLREVGTTNRTRPEDYAAAISDRTAAILRVHPSNFRIEGFAERPELAGVVDVGQRFDIPVVEDLGGGNLYGEIGHPPQRFDEPTVQQSVKSGVAICCFSGDKLLGGPQAGIIVGRESELATISRHPLIRALRVDKLTYAALEATLLEHLSGRARDTVPVTRMLHAEVDQLSTRAHDIVRQITTSSAVEVTITDGASAVGGGTAPGTTVASTLLSVTVEGLTPVMLEAKLRAATPPVVGRIDDGRLLLDLRTVAPHHDAALVGVLAGLT